MDFKTKEGKEKEETS